MKISFLPRESIYVFVGFPDQAAIIALTLRHRASSL